MEMTEEISSDTELFNENDEALNSLFDEAMVQSTSFVQSEQISTIKANAPLATRRDWQPPRNFVHSNLPKGH